MTNKVPSRETNAIAKTPQFIILERHEKIPQPSGYQSENDLEQELIADLRRQGYEYRKDINTSSKLLENLRIQLQTLNAITFNDDEWHRFVKDYLNNPAEGHLQKTRKIHDDFSKDFTFDSGEIRNIYLLDKKTPARNFLQVINQFSQIGTHKNRYDVTILINGLPLVQIELKKRGQSIREAFAQLQRYVKESFNAVPSLFKYVQMFVISNGTDTRYFANTTTSEQGSFDFGIHWADVNNEPIQDLKDFTATLLQKKTLLDVLLKYAVFDSKDRLLLLRPYQIAACERILWKITSAHQSKAHSSSEGNGFIWHTTGSGKTLTSFKTARLATQLPFVDKVLFVVDRKDLDYQTIKEYQRFSPDSVSGSADSAKLRQNLQRDDEKIIVTTIQKLNHLLKSYPDLPIYKKAVVLIFDECHRSQFGEAQRNIQKRFKRFYQFGFTGTPIFEKNAIGSNTTQSVFGTLLHSYIITDAIRDQKVLRFKVDYNAVRPRFKDIENEQDLQKLSAAENRKALLHPERIREVTQYILRNFEQKTHRQNSNSQGFNAIFAVSSVDAAKAYYEAFKHEQAATLPNKKLKAATIFSYAANEEQDSWAGGAVGDIADEGFEVQALSSTAKAFLQGAIADYNAQFFTNFGTDGQEFQNYYRDLAQRVRERQVDLLIVVGMFLTGFDSPRTNTLFVDKNLRYHGLIQAFSRTNRIFDISKPFGNIVCFRNLEQATIDAITLFGKNRFAKAAPNDRAKPPRDIEILLERSYSECMHGYTDPITGEKKRGYLELVEILNERFPEPSAITSEKEKKAFAQLFGEYLRVENVLQNYDEFASLQAMEGLNLDDARAVAAFKAKHYLSDEAFEKLQQTPILPTRQAQDYRSSYHDIRYWLQQEKQNADNAQQMLDWNDVVFEVDLLKSQEIDLDYILQLMFEKNASGEDKAQWTNDICRLIRASFGHRAKESLIVDFIAQTNLDDIKDKVSIIDAFFAYAQTMQQQAAQHLINSEQLKAAPARRYLKRSLKQEFASDSGTELNEILPPISRLHPAYLPLKQRILQRIREFVDIFKGTGGNI